jgi:glycerol-3-phosphate cytidylyltransferase
MDFIMKYEEGIVASCFDLLHAGHLLMLQEAKEHCEHLVVALQTDPTIDRPEKNKPVQSIFERWIQLDACKYVDQIILYETEEDLYNILSGYGWDVRFLGEDYLCRNDFTGANLNIPIHFCRRQHRYSSSDLRLRVYNSQSWKIAQKEV